MLFLDNGCQLLFPHFYTFLPQDLQIAQRNPEQKKVQQSLEHDKRLWVDPVRPDLSKFNGAVEGEH